MSQMIHALEMDADGQGYCCPHRGADAALPRTLRGNLSTLGDHPSSYERYPFKVVR